VARSQAKRKGSGGSRAGTWIVLILIVVLAGGYYAFRQGWRISRSHPAVAPNVAPPGAPLPASSGVEEAKQASFSTLEQLRQLSPKDAGKVVKVQARLLSYEIEPNQDVRLRLVSLVNPALLVEADLWPAKRATTEDDAALYDELREMLTLRFGSAAGGPVQPPANTIMVTGKAAFGAHGVELAPVLDLRVQ